MQTKIKQPICRYIAILFWISFCARGGVAQSNMVPQDASVETPVINSASDTASILRELQVMKGRIAELENQLRKAQSASYETAPDDAARLQAARNALLTGNHASRDPDPTLADARRSTVPAETSAALPTPSHREKAQPFAFADFTWLNGNPRIEQAPYDTKFFTPEVRADVDYTYDFRHPQDDTIGGSSEVFRANEVQLTQLGVGGDFHYENVRARLMTQFGMYATTTPRNDASYSRGNWDLADAYRYLSEAYGGYHFDALHGINVDAGIFMSYVGLFSYYNFDNWAYQPSYVSSNTPWFFTGVRTQIFLTDKLKIEPWFVNGWQSYGRYNNRPGIGGQILWRPNGQVSVLGNQYALGEDTLGNPGRVRYHTDDSVQYKYYGNPIGRHLSQGAFSLTGDAGCEHGGGVSCAGGSPKGPKQSFLGFMLYNRLWFDRNLFGVTLGGGRINNPGRYLVLLPPINGATASSGTSYFTENPGDKFKAWDGSATFDYMPRQYITWRMEYNHRVADVPYFSGPGGITPPGGDQGAPGSLVPGWGPDLRKSENRMTGAVLVMF
ncbi:MAG TPA: outer membrane beta-barrel protein [Terracidiphilus sp.]|nr:outer membrane beta-barrel protein [Terracidiphilus sp.]